ncbi:MAG: ABC transporter ATP-binding protein [Desulfobacterales bacterium]|nr:ABC transporter ATP-binding protein [Desulfobacterales bacterium]MBF0395264.1 ABC transporter ATP-binding protein [Desulfobacterales bacterium]
MNKILELKDSFVKRGGVSVIEIPSFVIQEGEIISIIGPNGTGKSTLLMTLACLIKFYKGDLFFKDKKLITRKDFFNYRRKIAMVFQEPLLFDTTVFNNIVSGLKIRGIKSKDFSGIIEYYVKKFSIEHLLDRSAKKLSGGEAKRVSLARAFSIKPEIVFLDEAFVSLDPPTRESLICDLSQILSETKTTAIIATHDLAEAVRLSSRIAVMNQGKIIQIGTPNKIINEPDNEFVSAFINIEKKLYDWRLR